MLTSVPVHRYRHQPAREYISPMCVCLYVHTYVHVFYVLFFVSEVCLLVHTYICDVYVCSYCLCSYIVGGLVIVYTFLGCEKVEL